MSADTIVVTVERFRPSDERKIRPSTKALIPILIALPLLTSFNTLSGERPDLTGIEVDNDLCDESMRQYIPKNYRLEGIYGDETCVVSIPGTVRNFGFSKDGDLVIDYVPDKKFKGLLNDANRNKLHGALRVEVMCMMDPTARDAAEDCEAYHENFESIPMPKLRKGMRISVTGQLVIDVGSNVLAKMHKGWVEIHPADKIVVIPVEKQRISQDPSSVIDLGRDYFDKSLIEDFDMYAKRKLGD